MWVHLYISDVQPSRQELHEQFMIPTTSSRRCVVHQVGSSVKSDTNVDIAEIRQIKLIEGNEVKVKIESLSLNKLNISQRT